MRLEVLVVSNNWCIDLSPLKIMTWRPHQRMMMMDQTVSHRALRLQKNFPTNLIWNFRRCFMVSLAQVLWRLKSMMFSVFFSTEKSQLRPAESLLCCNSVDYVYPSYLRRKDFDIFWDDRFHHISNIPTISTEYGHCIDWIYCGFRIQLQSSTAIHHKTS